MILSELKKSLTSKFGEEWYEYEVETLSIALGAIFDEKTCQKIMMLKAVRDNPELILNDADYFLRFVEVANGQVVDPHYHDIPTSLELVYAITELKRLIGDVPVTDMLSNVFRYVLNNEGHGEPYHKILAEYSKQEIIENSKTEAGDLYISEMDKSKGEG